MVPHQASPLRHLGVPWPPPPSSDRTITTYPTAAGENAQGRDGRRATRRPAGQAGHGHGGRPVHHQPHGSSDPGASSPANPGRHATRGPCDDTSRRSVCGGDDRREVRTSAIVTTRVPPSRVLLVASFGAFLAFLDATIVNVAFPSMRESFADNSIGELSWVARRRRRPRQPADRPPRRARRGPRGGGQHRVGERRSPATRAPAGPGSRRDAHAHDDDRQRGSGRRRTLPRCVGRESRVDGCRAPRVPPARPHGAGRASGRAGAPRAGRPRPWGGAPGIRRGGCRWRRRERGR